MLNRRCRINAARTRDAYTDHVQQHVGAVVPDSPEWNHPQDGSFELKRTGDGCQMSCRANIIGSDEKPSPTRSHKASIAAPCYILPNITVSVAHVHSIDTEIDATRAVQSNAGMMRIRVVHVLGQEVAVGEIPMSACDIRVAFQIKDAARRPWHRTCVTILRSTPSRVVLEERERPIGVLRLQKQAEPMVRRGTAQCRRPSSQRRPGGRLQSIGGCFACSSRSSRSTISRACCQYSSAHPSMLPSCCQSS